MDKKTYIWRGFYLWFLAALFLNFEMALQSAPSVMVDQLLLDLHLSTSQLGLLAGAFFFTYASMQIPAGMLMDKFRHWWPLWIATVLCTVGAFLFSHAHFLWQAMTARALMGTGGAFAFLGTLLIARRYLSPGHYALMVGLTQLIAALGPMIAQIALAWLLNHYDWQRVFQGAGWLGIFLFSAMLLAKPWSSAGSVMAPPSAQIIATRHLLWQVLKAPVTRWLALYAFCLWSPMVVVADLWGPKYLMLKAGWSATTAASYTSLMWFFLALSSLYLGWLIAHGRSVLKIMKGCAVGMMIAAILLVLPVSHIYLIVAMAILGLVVAGQAMSFVLVAKVHQANSQGLAAGVNNMAVVLSGAILQPLTAWSIQAFGHGHLTIRSVQTGFYWLILVALLALISCAKLKKHLITYPIH